MDVSMKKQLRYRSLTIDIGVVVALLIVLTLWTKTEVPLDALPAKPKGEITFAIKPVIQVLRAVAID